MLINEFTYIIAMKNRKKREMSSKHRCVDSSCFCCVCVCMTLVVILFEMLGYLLMFDNCWTSPLICLYSIELFVCNLVSNSAKLTFIFSCKRKWNIKVHSLYFIRKEFMLKYERNPSHRLIDSAAFFFRNIL